VFGEHDLERIGPILPGIARRAIGAWLAGEGYGKVLPAGFAAPVFVTLRDRDGALRGCVGSLRSSDEDVAFATARIAVLAATADPRFAPLTEAELALLVVEVGVPFDEREASAADLDAERFGVVVRDASGREGVLMPALAGVSDTADQVEIARRKADIPRDVAVETRRFRIRKWVDGG